MSDLTNIEWRFTEWIVQNGGLRPDNILEYFSLSPFWDTLSNNSILQMQTQFNDLQKSSLDLRQMTGIEFAVSHQEPPSLFIITKQRRSSPTRTTPISIFYILNGNIYQAPTLYEILSTRMLSSIKHVENALDVARNHSEFHPSFGYSWKEADEQKKTP